MLAVSRPWIKGQSDGEIIQAITSFSSEIFSARSLGQRGLGENPLRMLFYFSRKTGSRLTGLGARGALPAVLQGGN